MNEIKNILYKALIKMDFHLGNTVARILLTVFAIGFLFSLMNIATSHHQIKTNLAYLERAFVNKDPKLMQQVLQECKGNIFDVRVVQECHRDFYTKTMKNEKKRLWYAKLYFVLWALCLMLVSISYLALIKKQEELRNKYLNYDPEE